MDDLLDVGRVHRVGVLAVDGFVTRDRQRRERQVLAGKGLHIGEEVEQVPALIGDQVLLGDREQLGELAEVGEHALVLQFPDHVVDHRLLTVRAVQVAVGQVVPLPDEGQRLRRVEQVISGGNVRSRVGRIVGPVVQAHLDAAEDLRQPVEPLQVELGEVVDVHPGERLDRLDLR